MLDITVTFFAGEVYRGKLDEAEDNMNCQMSDVNVTFRDGRTHQLDNVYIRGSKIRSVFQWFHRFFHRFGVYILYHGQKKHNYFHSIHCQISTYHFRFMILPDMLKNAPMFKNIGRAQKASYCICYTFHIRPHYEYSVYCFVSVLNCAVMLAFFLTNYQFRI